MSVIVKDDGFHEAKPIDYDGLLEIWVDPADYDPQMDFKRAGLIAVNFASSADGRGFGIATELRERGYKGTLRAVGHVIADQYTMARRVGFDEVEISDERAKRQDEAQWLARSNWKAFDYQTRLGQVRGA